MNYDIEQIKHIIDSIYTQLIDIRRDIHMHPELSEQEKRTSDLICNILSELNISYERSTSTHAVIGIINGISPSGSCIGIRADMDALPIFEASNLSYASVNEGIMHACGHDIHTATLLGTAMVLSKLKDCFEGTVKLLFQPAEETCGGALAMIEEGCLLNPTVNYIIGLHIDPFVKTGAISLTPGSMNAASTEFYVTINGKSCHAAHPDKGIDPLLVACDIITSYQKILTRKLSPSKNGLITVSKFNCGTKNNIISDKATFSGIIRATTLSDRSFLKKEMLKLTEGISNTYDTIASITFEDSYPNLFNDESMFKIISELGSAALGPDNVIIENGISMGADDFSYFTHDSKGFYFNLGTMSSDCTEIFPLHSKHLQPDENSIRTGILMEVITTLELLQRGN